MFRPSQAVKPQSAGTDDVGVKLNNLHHVLREAKLLDGGNSIDFMYAKMNFVDA